jgi:hypothetical protein
MNRLVYVVVVILLVLWFIGAFVHTVGQIIHLLLVAAIVILVIKALRPRRG